MDSHTNTLSLTYASWRNELDILANLARTMRGFVQTYATPGPHSSSLSWLLTFVRDPAEVDLSEVDLTRDPPFQPSLVPFPACEGGMDGGAILHLIFARVDLLLLRIRQTTRLSKSPNARVCEAQTLEFRARLNHEAGDCLREVGDFVWGEGPSSPGPGFQLTMLTFIQKNYMPSSVGGKMGALGRIPHDCRNPAAMDYPGKKPDHPSFFSPEEAEDGREFRRVFRWQTALRQRARYFRLAEAHDYAAAAHLWRRIAAELSTFAIVPAAGEALTRGILSTSAACGVWMADGIAPGGEESPLPGWIHRVLHSRLRVCPDKRQTRRNLGGGKARAAVSTASGAAFSVGIAAVNEEKEEVEESEEHQEDEGVALGKGGGLSSSRERTTPRQLSMVYAALMSLATTLEQDFGCLDEAVNFYELAGLVLIEESAPSQRRTPSRRAGDCFLNPTGDVKAESDSLAPRFRLSTEREGIISTREVKKLSPRRGLSDFSGLTNSLAQGLRRRRQRTLAGLFTRYGIDQQLRHSGNGSFSFSSRRVPALLDDHPWRTPLESAAVREGRSKGNFHKDPTSSTTPAGASPPNLLTCLRQGRNFSFHDGINTSGYLWLFLRSMRKAALVSATLGDYPRVLLYIEAASKALSEEAQKAQELQTTSTSNVSEEANASSLDLEGLLSFRPPSSPLWEVQSRGEITFCLEFLSVEVFFLLLRFLVLLVVDESHLTVNAKHPRDGDDDVKRCSGGKAAELEEPSTQSHFSNEDTQPHCGKGPISTSPAALASLEALKILEARARKIEAACIVVNLSPASFEPLARNPEAKEGGSEEKTITPANPPNLRKAPHYGYFPMPARIGKISTTLTGGGDASGGFSSGEKPSTMAGARAGSPGGVVRGAAYKILKAHVLAEAAEPRRPPGAHSAMSSKSSKGEASSLSGDDDFSGDGGLPSLFRCSQEGPSGERTRVADWAKCHGGSVSGRKAVVELNRAVENGRFERRTYCDILNELLGVLRTLYTQATQSCPLAGLFVEQVAPQDEGREGMTNNHGGDSWNIDHRFNEGCPSVKLCGDCTASLGEGSACDYSRAPSRVTNDHTENIPRVSACTSSTHNDYLQRMREAREILTRQMDKLEDLLVYLGLRNRVFLMLMRRLQRKWCYPNFSSTPFTFSSSHRNEKKA
ncbi:unnamed protein product [Phytomonas sp. Hart1]|nr:unnamed protein product [Phytomonas sp. Hart1]|eukprot:CCW66668.1 unnamed protein product [Phytomonas sp. isolate Hart1]